MSALTRSHVTSGFSRSRSAGRQGLVLGIAMMVETWFERHRQRRALLELSDHMLKDIGLSRADVAEETAKPFWR